MGKDGRSYWPIKRQAATADRIANHKGRNPQERASLKKRLLRKWMSKMNLSTIGRWLSLGRESLKKQNSQPATRARRRQSASGLRGDQERIREHVVATNDMRLFGLLHLPRAGVAAHGANAVAGRICADDPPRSKLSEGRRPQRQVVPPEEVMQAMRERIDQARNKTMLIG